MGKLALEGDFRLDVEITLNAPAHGAPEWS